jgi:hypothetical protein
VRLDHRFDRRFVYIAYDHDRHEIGSIPVRVKLLEPGGIRVLDDLRCADRQAFGIARPFQQHRKLLVGNPLASAEPEPPFLEDDATLLLDLRRIERDVVRPVLHDEQRPIDDGGVLGRNLKLVNRLVEAGVRVDVRAEAHPERLHEIDDFEPRKVERPVEGHVLHEMREPSLVVLLQH